MRTRLPIHVFLFIAIVAIPALAQKGDSLHTDAPDTLRLPPLSAIESIGTSPIPIRAINDFLAENKFGGSGLPNDLLTVGVDEYLAFGSWRAGLGVQLATIPTPDIHYSYWSLQASTGYQIPVVGRLRLIPYAVIGARFNRLEVSNDGQSRFGAFLNDSNAHDFTLSNTTYQAELGAGIDYAIPFPFMKDEDSTDILLGLRAGYVQGLFGNGWHRDGTKLDGGPDMRPGGLAAWLTLGWQMRFHVVDSATIAARRARWQKLNEEDAKIPRWRFGLTGGATINSFGSPGHNPLNRFQTIYYETDNAAAFGAMASYRVWRSFSMQANLLYTTKTGSVGDDSRFWNPVVQVDPISGRVVSIDNYISTSIYSASYIELPVMASFRIPLGEVLALHLSGGIYGGLLVNSSVEHQRDYSEYTSVPGTVDLKPLDAGGVAGFGIDVITKGPAFTLEGRGDFGFGNINRGGQDLHPSTAYILVGCWF
jgi:hypothetical protein